MDTSVYHALNNLAFENKAVGDLAKFFAQYAIFVMVGAVALAWFARTRSGCLLSHRQRSALFFAGLATILGLVIVQIINHIWDRPRPFVVLHEFHKLIAHAADASFPSDHATGAFAIFFALALFRRPAAAALALVWAVLIGVARVMVGVHWPTDILGGLGVGAFAALVLWTAPLRAPLLRLEGLCTDLYERLLPAAWKGGAPAALPALEGSGERPRPQSAGKLPSASK
ncbi:MAG TPA: undecaprenyl-diphosphatase [Solirubrobacteraceae bacterium]|nr:undecaprenyl-diphosphatase [Solirubrobacteraceae bacterium]